MKARSTIKAELREVQGALGRADLNPEDQRRLRALEHTLLWCLEGAKARRHCGWVSPLSRILKTRRKRS